MTNPGRTFASLGRVSPQLFCRLEVLLVLRVLSAHLRMSLLKSAFPGKADAEYLKLWDRLLKTKETKQMYKPSCMQAVLQELQQEKDASSFQTLKEQVDELTRTEIVLKRCGHTKEQAMNRTPLIIKRLKPPVEKSILCWQANLEAFEGYFPRPGAAEDKKKGKRVKTHWSASRSYGPGLRSQADALWQIVRFLWTHHKKMGGDSRLIRYRPWFS